MTFTLDDFRQAFDERVQQGKLNWNVMGFIGADGNVYPFGTDSKVLSTVFESLVAPTIAEIAAANGYDVNLPSQTIYPDFALVPKSGKKTNSCIAIDIKTTYRKSGNIVYTLGSYTSFLRDGTKNILGHLSDYRAHWVLGFLYSRTEGVEAKVYHSTEDIAPQCPYSDVEYFIQDKYKIAGDKPGSGNTANIGSFKTNKLDDLAAGRGPFAKLGHEVFEDYWKHYPKPGAKQKPFLDLPSYHNWRS